MNRITHSVGTAGVAPAQLPSGSYRLTTGFAHSSGYLLTVVSFSPALAATPNSMDRAGIEPASFTGLTGCRLADSELLAGIGAPPCVSPSTPPIRWPSLRPVAAPQFAHRYSRGHASAKGRSSAAVAVSMGRAGLEPAGLASGTRFTVSPLHHSSTYPSPVSARPWLPSR